MPQSNPQVTLHHKMSYMDLLSRTKHLCALILQSQIFSRTILINFIYFITLFDDFILFITSQFPKSSNYFSFYIMLQVVHDGEHSAVQHLLCMNN